MSRELSEAIDRCRETKGSADALALLRKEIWPVLTDRLTVLTTDGHLIEDIIIEATALFASQVSDTGKINWKAWIVATALRIACERVDATARLDSAAATLHGETQERRTLLLGTILTLGPPCEWALLEMIAGESGPRTPLLLSKCMLKLRMRCEIFS